MLLGRAYNIIYISHLISQRTGIYKNVLDAIFCEKINSFCRLFFEDTSECTVHLFFMFFSRSRRYEITNRIFAVAKDSYKVVNGIR